jgi:hypothetical protein
MEVSIFTMQGKLKTFTGKGQLFANCYGHAFWMVTAGITMLRTR